FGFGFLATAEKREAFAREAAEDVRAAAFLGAPAVAFHLGNEAVSEDQLAEANAAVLREAVRVAREEGVVVALENHCHGWGDRWEQLEAVARLLDSPAVGFTLDSGHAVVAGQDPVELARRMGSRLALTHLHDNDGSGDLHRPAGRSGVNGSLEGGGRIDWPTLIEALREVGYPERNAWMLEGGTQVAGDEVQALLEAHIAAFRPFVTRS
ncbi:MAG TPA: sugar phosphate isomerase/epimerase, partial [Chloroflexota bacterium]|nr:sugar phosphate isomerase/epimerase [Chloroflexota bacterium]